MTLPTPTIPEQKPAYEPTSSQLERESSLNRFNWMFVYIPVILAGLIVMGIVFWMIWAALTASQEDHVLSLLSGLADITLIFFVILPSMLLCAVGPALLALIASRTSKRMKLEPAQRRSKLQVLLWRLDKLVETVQTRLRDSYLDSAAKPVIKGHAISAALRATAVSLSKLFRSKKG
ncbi:MAG: hypothetical protein H6662_10010 [Ardenticatenaceae bacterium]|nr:hypothetical protein [Anaerolineales bacterium]MCB8921909.1 hypothetical protein [Ardenticatenaceae bacterium]MCB8989484.1 hypothetical protein [Ardenticatenaceae bacterium]